MSAGCVNRKHTSTGYSWSVVGSRVVFASECHYWFKENKVACFFFAFVEIKPFNMIYMTASLVLWTVCRSKPKSPGHFQKCNSESFLDVLELSSCYNLSCEPSRWGLGKSPTLGEMMEDESRVITDEGKLV